MHIHSNANEKFFGLLELNTDGTVLYSRIEKDDGLRQSTKLIGRNFFKEIASFQNVGELEQYLVKFGQGSAQANSINFTCQYEDGPVPVRILLARVRKSSANDVTKSILMYIKSNP